MAVPLNFWCSGRAGVLVTDQWPLEITPVLSILHSIYVEGQAHCLALHSYRGSLPCAGFLGGVYLFKSGVHLFFFMHNPGRQRN